MPKSCIQIGGRALRRDRDAVARRAPSCPCARASAGCPTASTGAPQVEQLEAQRAGRAPRAADRATCRGSGRVSRAIISMSGTAARAAKSSRYPAGNAPPNARNSSLPRASKTNRSRAPAGHGVVLLDLLRRELVGDRPARRPRDHAEPRLLVEAIDLDHDPVGLVRQLVPRFLPLLEEAMTPSMSSPLRWCGSTGKPSAASRSSAADCRSTVVPCSTSV